MSKSHTVVLIIIVLLVIIAICGVVYYAKLRSARQFHSIVYQYPVYYRLNDNMDYTAPSLEMMKAIDDVAKEKNITMQKASTYFVANFLLFETLNNIDNIMNSIKYPPNVRYIHGIAGSDKLASKSSLALVLRRSLPKQVVDSIMPISYVTHISTDMKQFATDFNEKTIYVMKKNVQQQTGFILTSSYNEIMDNYKNYVVIQAMLQDPYLVKGKKVNMRVYMLVIIREDSSIHFSYYHDGFMYYTVDDFKPYSKNSSEVITTGLAGRDMYADKPLTHQDFFRYLGPEKASTLRANMTSLVRYLKVAYEPILRADNSKLPGTKFLIYGVDVAPASDLSCKVMEVNKGPDLTYKDDRDKMVKMHMLYDSMCTTGVFREAIESKFIVV